MSLPVVSPPKHPVDQGPESSVAGVLLAAGTSSRYGERNKLLEPIEGPERDDAVPMVRRSAETLLAAGLEPVVVVVGHEAPRVRAALDDLDVRFVENPDYEQGQATSVGAGIRALPDVDAAVFALGDMPYVETASVGKLIAAYEAGAGSALAAGYEGERGNPVLFDAAHFPALAGREGDVGGKQVLLSADDAAVVETGDPGVRRDVDQPDDLA
jgi:molybdenum cofactor cytidylyltransferase